MKKLLLSVILAVASFVGTSAQNWSTTLNGSHGLPGTIEASAGKEFYYYLSPLMSPGVVTDKIRITVLETVTNEAPNGNNVIFVFSELKVYDENGKEISYVASSNADHNTLSGDRDGGGLPALSDNDVSTYFHSMWSGNNAVPENHYIELDLATSVSSFSLQWCSRLGEPKNTPIIVGVTLGTDYTPGSESAGFSLGEAVTSEQELAAAGQLFVLKGNAVKFFNSASGTTYTGSGPLYMLYAEEGDVEPNISHSMQLVPAGDGCYLVYWPMSGKFLANSSSIYNGLNGWQHSTGDFTEAAMVKLTAVDGGYFEMQYDGENSAGPLTLYVGAEMRDYVNSKMKTFDLEHKTALENGDYTKGYSLPVAFNWSIFKATLDEATVAALSISVATLADSHLRPIIDKSYGYLKNYVDHNGYCNGEDEALEILLSTVEGSIATMGSVADIMDAETDILRALSVYMSVGLTKYEVQANDILASAEFSQYPYTPGTYPESSRAILSSIISTIADAKEHAGEYTATQYESIFAQVANDINSFLSTRVKESSGGDGGGGNGGGTLVEGEVVYVYLSDGSIDAYSLASLDGNYYTENGKLYFPISGSDVVYYEKAEYDSCSMVAPQLPTMISYKFNNKYNPNLNVDAEATTISENMHFQLNAIGKWLTASFNLSDSKAVAFVDTVLQESKVTRQDFAEAVTYTVTYPGYNIVERVKVQDEVWTDPSVEGEVTEVALKADMLSTNKPSQNANESLANLLDGDYTTIFHSTWGSANNATLNVNTYISIDLPEALDKIQLYYCCRPNGGYNPLVWEIYASNDGNWTHVRTLDYINDNMPTGGSGQEYTSPTIDLNGSYSKIRIVQTSGEYAKNHLVLSELRVFKVAASNKEPEKIQDAVYENRYRPFGRDYKVSVEWLTDNAVSVPRIDIDIEGGKTVTSKSYYLNANFRITGYGIYEDFEDSVQIKGRGNSTWGYSKKPYRLKFDEKVKPFGLTKGKSWVLLANAQSGALMANAIAMKVGQMAGAKYTNHIIPVELYMNGTYLGSYMFTEKVGMGNNSVDIDEALGYLLELDTYTDETITRIGQYNLPVKVSEPDLTELSKDSADVRMSRIKADIEALSSVLYYGGDLEGVLDVDATARFYLANDLVLNQEINHPKSTYLFKDESAPDGRVTFGPLWDFDWGFGYEDNASYCYSGATSSVIKSSMAAYMFWQDMNRFEVFKKHYYKVWKEFVEKNCVEELLDYIDDYYRFAENSFINNSYIWGYGGSFSETDAQRAKDWIKTRVDFIYNNLSKYEIDDLINALPGDVNCDNAVTIHDVALITSYLAGIDHPEFNMKKADYDGDGYIYEEDVEGVADLLLGSEAPSAMYWYNTPVAAGEYYAKEFTLEQGVDVVAPLSLLSYNNEPYNAIQFDLKVPDGLFINDITAGDCLAKHVFNFSQLDMNTYRVVAYTEDNSTFTTGDDVVANINMMTTTVIDENLRRIDICNAYAVNKANDEVRMNDVSMLFNESTGIEGIYATVSVKGGECVVITALEAQTVSIYSVDGRLVRKVNVTDGTTRVALPAGMYIVNGEKILVY
ncbi:MAG: CotH kinase family protein [Bacteroidaceae bacterium]|nr:CotH kinase family protein [Bacteroidaceae bacterium]